MSPHLCDPEVGIEASLWVKQEIPERKMKQLNGTRIVLRN
jgi:hypothetical protein